jgi:hypothetical protein
MPRTLHLSAQETATIYRRNFSSVPMEIHFDARAASGSEPIGEVEVQGSNWVFPKPAVVQPLQPQNTVHVGFWDTFFSIQVTAHTDLEITFPGRQLDPSRWLIWAIAAAVLIVAVSVFILTLS